MKKFAVLALALMLAVAVVPSLAIPVADEQFNYTAGSDLNGLSGGSGWANAWSSTPGTFTITSPGLVFPGLITAGNAVSAGDFGGSNQVALRDLLSPFGTPGSVTNFSYLIRPDASFGQWGSIVLEGPAAGGVQVGFLNLSGKYLYIQQGLTKSQVAYAFSAGQTYLIQGQLSVDALGNGTMQAWVWSTNSGPDATVSMSVGSGWSGYDTVTLNSSSFYTYDDFYFGDRPNDPVPEAGTMVALGSFLSMGGLFLRRRFAKS